MSAWAVRLDPAAVAPAGRAELDLNSGPISVAAVDWGEAAVKQFLSEARYGEQPVSYRVPNRIVTLTLGLGMTASGETEEEGRRRLEQKVALLQREGGALLRQREGGEPLYADIIDAGLTLPDVWGETAEVEPNVVVRLTCLPDFYGAEQELEAIFGEGEIAARLEMSVESPVGSGKYKPFPAVIDGDYPARCRIIVKDEAGTDARKGMFWGFRSAHYSAASTAALAYDAKQMTLINGAEEATNALSYSGKWVRLGTPQQNAWHPFLTTDLKAGGPLTHLGTYRVWGRFYMAAEQKVRLSWSADDATALTRNDAVATGTAPLVVVDLGEVRLEAPPVGEHWWRGVVEAEAGNAGLAIIVDRLWLQPIDEGAGRLRAAATPAPTAVTPRREGPPEEVIGTGAGKAWTVTPGSARVTLSASETSQILALRKYGFNLLTSGSPVVHGIEIYLLNWQTVAVVGDVATPASLTVQLYKASALAGSAKTLVEGQHQAGGPSDLWNTTWTAAQINEEGFGIAIKAVCPAHSLDTVQVIPAVGLRIYYSFSGVAPTEDAVLYASKTMEIRTEGAFRQDKTSGAYVPVSSVLGDLPRLPPSGIENRPVQLLLKGSLGDLTTNLGDEEPKEKLTVTVRYRPCYVGRL